MEVTIEKSINNLIILETEMPKLIVNENNIGGYGREKHNFVWY